MKLPFRTPYPRPSRFSDPFHDWAGPEGPRAILAKPDDQLDWDDFSGIFHWDTPVGTYEEIIYFLPLGLDYIRRNPQDGYECQTNLVYFISANAQRLEQDGLLEPSRQVIQDCFAEWTAGFRVQHYDLAACQERGWRLDHDDIVENSQIVRDLIEDLLRYKVHADLAEAVVAAWASQQDDPVKSAWFLEYARVVRERLEFEGMTAEDHDRLRQSLEAGFIRYNIPFTQEGLLSISEGLRKHEDSTTSNPAIMQRVMDHSLLTSHAQRVRQTLSLREVSPTYWPDLYRKLGVD